MYTAHICRATQPWGCSELSLFLTPSISIETLHTPRWSCRLCYTASKASINQKKTQFNSIPKMKWKSSGTLCSTMLILQSILILFRINEIIYRFAVTHAQILKGATLLILHSQLDRPRWQNMTWVEYSHAAIGNLCLLQWFSQRCSSFFAIGPCTVPMSAMWQIGTDGSAPNCSFYSFVYNLLFLLG